MPTRRQVLIAATAAPALAGCGKSTEYESVAAAVWSDPADQSAPAGMIHYATLAANSHNTQPWRFALGRDGIDIRADRTRATPVVDPDGHHLFASLGCAAENLALAAGAEGRTASVGDLDGDRLPVALGRGPATRDPLFDAILMRQSSRTLYDGRPVENAGLRDLERAATLPGVRAILITDRAQLEQALEMIVAGNDAQMADPAFVRELIHWMRFNGAAAVQSRDGLFAGTVGSPELPQWLGRWIVPYFLRRPAETDRIAANLRSSAGLAVIVSDQDEPGHWVTAGRAVQRFALQATALGLRQCFMNQPVEVAAMRPNFARWLGLDGGRPDLILRFGGGPTAPRSLRRPVEQVFA